MPADAAPPAGPDHKLANLWYDLRIEAQDGLTDDAWRRKTQQIEAHIRAAARAPGREP